MKVDSTLLSILKETVALKFGHTPGTPSDFDELALDIQLCTGRTIGVSTLKRLWGYVRSDIGTTFSTLSLISRYVGYNDWDAFCRAKAGIISDDDSDFCSDNLINCSSLPIGETLALRWNRNKLLVIRKIEHPERFEVLHSENVKLAIHDVADISCLAIKRPFMAGHCMRGYKLLGSYTAARREGITSIEVLHD